MQPFRGLLRLYRQRLTERGRFLLAAVLVIALAGADTRRALVFILFSLAAPPLLLAAPLALRQAPRLRLRGQLPSRLTAGLPVSLGLELVDETARGSGPLSLAWAAPLPHGLSAALSHPYLQSAAGRPARVSLTLHAARRGRYVLPPLGVAGTDWFGLFRTQSEWLPGRVVLAYPRYRAAATAPEPSGRRYQPGGIPLASEVGESLEFVGTREFRPGDPPRKIDWRSSARLGRPVVKEYQQEYFSRVALLLDTYLPRRRRAVHLARFEAAVSVLASVAEQLSRREAVVDILAAGPDLFEVSTGRSLGSLDDVLEILACLEPCSSTAYATIAPNLFERLERLTSVVAVLLDWDSSRAAFLQRVAALGVSVHVLLVHEAEPGSPLPAEGGAIAGLDLVRPAEVAARLAAAEAS